MRRPRQDRRTGSQARVTASAGTPHATAQTSLPLFPMIGPFRAKLARTGTTVSASISDPTSSRADRDRHRPEHAAFQILESEDRQVHRDDDGNSEHNGPRYFVRGRRESLPAGCASDREPTAHRVLHHHDGAVHDHAEVDRAETHQVRGDSEQPPCRESRTASRSESPTPR